MKPCWRRQQSSIPCRQHLPLRRASIFHYLLIYMTIASALMTVSGLVLHTILRADSSERRAALFLQSLLRAEQRLRADSRIGALNVSSETTMVLSSQDDTRIVWSANRGILTRTEHRDTELAGSDRFIFPAGTQIQIHQHTSETAQNSVVVRFTEPSAFVVYARSASGGSDLNKPIDTAIPVTPPHVAQPHTSEIRLRGATP